MVFDPCMLVPLVGVTVLECSFRGLDAEERATFRITPAGIGPEAVRDFEKAQEGEAFGIGAATLLPWNLFFGGSMRVVRSTKSRINSTSVRNWSSI